jgi:hypothetical protein
VWEILRELQKSCILSVGSLARGKVGTGSGRIDKYVEGELYEMKDSRLMNISMIGPVGGGKER